MLAYRAFFLETLPTRLQVLFEDGSTLEIFFSRNLPSTPPKDERQTFAFKLGNSSVKRKQNKKIQEKKMKNKDRKSLFEWRRQKIYMNADKPKKSILSFCDVIRLKTYIYVIFPYTIIFIVIIWNWFFLLTDSADFSALHYIYIYILAISLNYCNVGNQEKNYRHNEYLVSWLVGWLLVSW